MSEIVTTTIFGTLILAALGYLGSRIDRLAEKVAMMGERLAAVEVEVHNQGDRITRIEGRTP